ncbi:MAG TPA: hypothetical protein VFL82_06040 [Thermomicrobiales bacterium]|nr:hypothetical protein [Thermomicrobiales bacterium]
MKWSGFVWRFAAVFMALSLLSLSQLASVDASTRYARITLHVNECPWNTSDVFGKCHENRVEGFTFYLAGKAKTTNANGIASGAPSAGWHTVWPNGNDLAPYYNAAKPSRPSYVYCTDQVSGAVLVDGYFFSGIRFTTKAGQPVVCDWYLLLY